MQAPLFLDLAPSVEARLRAAAGAQDLSVSEFVKSLLARFEEGQAESSPEDAAEEEPEKSIEQFVTTSMEARLENRELIVQAITEKNNLQAEVERQKRMLGELDRRGIAALRAGNRNLAKQFYKEQILQEKVLGIMQVHLTTAEDAVAKLKEIIIQQENGFRMRVAEAHVARVIMNHARIFENVYRVLFRAQSTPTFAFEWTEEHEKTFEAWTRMHENPEDAPGTAPGTEADI